MVNKKINLLVMLFWSLGSGMCFSQEVLPYWEAEVVYGRRVPRFLSEPNYLADFREVLVPKGGGFYKFASFATERYKEACAQLFPEEIGFLIELDRELSVLPECQIPLMVQLSGIKDIQGFRHIEGLCILLQDGPDELFLSRYTCPGINETVDLGLLQQFAVLKHLEIFGCSLKQFNIQNLSELKSLEYLGLPYDSNDTTLDLLSSLDRLEFINAGSTRITGTNFEDLAKLPNLKILDLRYTRLTENAIAKLKNAKNLKTLLLTGAEITDRHLEGIEELKGLQNLALTNTRITDSSLKYIVKLPNLRYLTLGQTNVTNQKLQALQTSNPNLTISLNPVLTWEEYKKQNIYRDATLYGDIDAQIQVFHRYNEVFHMIEKNLYSEEQREEVFSKSDPQQYPYDPIELLKWIYIIFDPGKSLREAGRIRRHLPALNEVKEILEKRLHVCEIAEARRRADIALSLVNDYKLTHKSKYEYLPIYQTDFPFIKVSSD